MQVVRDSGSYRDPSGRVYSCGQRVLRTISRRAAEDYLYVKRSGVIDELSSGGWLVESREIPIADFDFKDEEVYCLVEHERIPYISYPYEWPFSLLQRAALHHLDLHLRLLDHGVTLSDASAYNVQFRGVKPVFIDLLSLRPYREGEFWVGHRQFCEQFLHPLLLASCVGVPHNAWYRGTLEGIPADEIARVLPFRRKLSLNVLMHVVLTARLQQRAIGQSAEGLSTLKERRLPLAAFRRMLQSLRRWIAGLSPRWERRTVWGSYANNNTYEDQGREEKRRFIVEFAAATKPGLMWDLGCNTGDYSEVALSNGAGSVVGFDFDRSALEGAFQRANDQGLSLLPLFLDAANPSPGQGWNGKERMGLAERASADGLLALAFIHHLAIGRNVPLEEVVRWLVRMAPRGVIEFVPKTDPTVKWMLALREDVFEDYSESTFTQLLSNEARIVTSRSVSGSQRKLFWFDRT